MVSPNSDQFQRQMMAVELKPMAQVNPMGRVPTIPCIQMDLFTAVIFGDQDGVLQ